MSVVHPLQIFLIEGVMQMETGGGSILELYAHFYNVWSINTSTLRSSVAETTLLHWTYQTLKPMIQKPYDNDTISPVRLSLDLI